MILRASSRVFATAFVFFFMAFAVTFFPSITSAQESESGSNAGGGGHEGGHAEGGYGGGGSDGYGGDSGGYQGGSGGEGGQESGSAGTGSGDKGGTETPTGGEGKDGGYTDGGYSKEGTDSKVESKDSTNDTSFWGGLWTEKEATSDKLSDENETKSWTNWVDEKVVEPVGQFINATFFPPLTDVPLPTPDEEKTEPVTPPVTEVLEQPTLQTPAAFFLSLLDNLYSVTPPNVPPEENVPQEDMQTPIAPVTNTWSWNFPSFTFNFDWLGEEEPDSIPGAQFVQTGPTISFVGNIRESQPTTQWSNPPVVAEDSPVETPTEPQREMTVSQPTTNWGSEGSAITNILDPLEKETEPDDCELALMEEGPEELPEAPIDLVGSCSGTTVTVSWASGGGSKCYAVQVDNLGSPWKMGESGYPNCTSNSPASPSGDVCTDLYPYTSLSFKGQPGATYGWWVNGWNGIGMGPVATGNTFSCPFASSTPYTQ